MKEYLQYILEDNLGHAYEKEIVDKLKKIKFTPKEFQGAGSSNIHADAVFIHNRKEYNLEVKQKPSADFGQIELKVENGKWIFGGKNEEMKQLYTDMKILNYLKKVPIPLRYQKPLSKLTWKDRQKDQENFNDIYIPVSVDVIDSFYANKDTFYIQIKSKGFYYLSVNKAKLKGVPKFNPKEVKIRIRFKYRYGGVVSGYGFVCALIPYGIENSIYDLDDKNKLPPISGII